MKTKPINKNCIYFPYPSDVLELLKTLDRR